MGETGLRLFPSLLICASLMLTFCSGGGVLQRESGGKPMHAHEEDFDPVAYRPVAPDTIASEERIPPVEAAPKEVWVERRERTMGFRVQLHSTTSLDEAQSSLAAYRSRLDSLQIDAGRLDMVFDAPYYKIRAGDFLRKADADEMTVTLREAGVSEAWVVRDAVYRMVRERKKD